MFYLADANPYLPAPSYVNSGDTAWQLTSATLVGLMSLPALAILYGGLRQEEVGAQLRRDVLLRLRGRAHRVDAMGLSDGFRSSGSGSASELFRCPGPSFGADAEMGQASIPLAAAAMPPMRFSGPR